MTESTAPRSRPAFAWLPLAAVAVAALAVHLVCIKQYGWFRDELYYLSCARRLAWGYVDQPPFSIAVLALVRAIGGDCLFAARIVAVAVSIATGAIAAAIARERGGRAFAQGLASFTVTFAPIALGVGHYFSMNVFDFAFWALATLLAMRALERGRTRTWIALGLALGLGLLDKWSVMWLGVGLAAAIVLSPRRRVLATAGPWLAAGIALVVFAPHLAWQVRHDWPTLEFIHNATERKMAAMSVPSFLLGQLLALGPGAATVWIAGLVAAFRPRHPEGRLAGIVYVVTLAILLSHRGARVEYLTLAAPALFAEGAAWWESRGRALRAAVGLVAIALAIPVLPLALPILPVDSFIAYQQRIGMAPRTEERHRMGALPQHYADMFGWPELADSVARVAGTLPADEFRRTIVVVDNYGEAGALELFGHGRIPAIACQHNNWYLWGPPAWDRGTMILVGRDSAEVASEFDEVNVAGTAGHPLAMPYERDLPIVIARGFRPDLAKAWEQGRHFQ